MPEYASKILPLHFPTLTDNFDTKTEEQISGECEVPNNPFRQIWSTADSIQLYFLDNNALFAPVIRIRDTTSNEIFNTVGLSVNFPHYYFAIPLTNFGGRTIVAELGQSSGGNFSLRHTSKPVDVLHASHELLACSYVVKYWGCSDDYGVQWLDGVQTVTPTLPFEIRLTDAIRPLNRQFTRTVSENGAKYYSVCGSEVDFIKVLRMEYSPLYWSEKVELIMSMRNVEIDGVRYIQEAPLQLGQQLRRYPLFKAEMLLRLGEQDNLYKFGCC